MQLPRIFTTTPFLKALIVVLLITVLIIGFYLGINFQNNKRINESGLGKTLNISPTRNIADQHFSSTPNKATPTSLKVYKNTNYGYELSYPSNWEIVEAKDRDEFPKGPIWIGNILVEGELQKITFIDARHMFRLMFEISVTLNSENMTVEQLYDQYDNHKTMLALDGEIYIDGIKGMELHYVCCDYPGNRIIMLLYNGYLYKISFLDISSYDEGNQDLKYTLSQVLSSFKFIQ